MGSCRETAGIIATNSCACGFKRALQLGRLSEMSLPALADLGIERKPRRLVYGGHNAQGLGKSGLKAVSGTQSLLPADASQREAKKLTRLPSFLERKPAPARERPCHTDPPSVQAIE